MLEANISKRTCQISKTKFIQPNGLLIKFKGFIAESHFKKTVAFYHLGQCGPLRNYQFNKLSLFLMVNFVLFLYQLYITYTF